MFLYDRVDRAGKQLEIYALPDIQAVFRCKPFSWRLAGFNVPVFVRVVHDCPIGAELAHLFDPLELSQSI